MQKFTRFMKIGFALMFVLALVSVAVAHEGHQTMGTVAAIHDTHLEVKATNGKTSTFTLDDKTKVLRGKVAMKLADLKVGDRVVVTATDMKGKDGKVMLMATEVRVGGAPAPKAAR